MTDEQARMLEDLHTALMSVPPGSGPDAQPLIQEVRTVVNAYKRGSWAVRALIWLLPALAGVGIAIEKIAKWLGHGQ